MNPVKSFSVLGFLTVLNILNFIDRQLLTSFSNFIVPELELTNTQFGILSGLAFIVFYSVMGVIMGAIADRVNRPKLMAFGVALWSLLTAASGLAKNFWMVVQTPENHEISKGLGFTVHGMTLKQRKRAQRMEPQDGVLFYVKGIKKWTAVASITSKYFENRSVIWKSTTSHNELYPFRVNMKRESFIESIYELREIIKGSYPLRMTIYGSIAANFILGALVFDQLWLVNDKGFDRADILIISGTIGLPAGLLGNLFGGIGSDYFTKITGKGRQMFLFWCLLIFTPFIIFYRLTDDTGVVFFSLMFLGFFQWGCLYGPITSSIQELAPEKNKALVLAYYLFLTNLIGIGLSTTAAGIMTDILIANSIENPYSITLLSFQLLSGLCLPAFYSAGKNYNPA